MGNNSVRQKLPERAECDGNAFCEHAHNFSANGQVQHESCRVDIWRADDS